MRTRTRDKAVVQPVSLPSSRTETWGKLPGSPARLCARFLALVSWCPGCVGGPGLWPSVPVLSVCPVSSCAPGLVASSGFVSGTSSFFFLKWGFCPGNRPKDRFFDRYPFYSQGSYDLLGRGTCGFYGSFLSSPSPSTPTDVVSFRRCGVPWSVCCGSGRLLPTHSHREGLSQVFPDTSCSMGPLSFREVTHERRWFPWRLV